MAQQLGVRSFLTGKGYKNEDITYDPNRSMVQLKGMDFGQFTPQADGSTYGDFNGLNSQLNSFKTQQRNTQLDGLVNQLVTKSQAPPSFQYKAPAPYSFDPASNPLYQAAQREAGRNVAAAEGNIAAAQNKRGIMNSTITANLGNQAAQQAYGHVTDVVLPQIAQQDYNQYSDQANRDLQYQDRNYGMQRDQNKDLSALVPLLTGMNQDEFNNNRLTQQDARQTKLDNIGAAATVGGQLGRVLQPKEDWSNLYNQTDAPLSMQGQQQQLQNTQVMGQLTGQLPNGQATTAEQQRQLENLWTAAQQTGTIPNELADLYGLPRGTQTQSAMASAFTRGNQASGTLLDVWRNSGKAPAGLESLGIQPGTPYYDPTAARQADKPQTAEDFSKSIIAQPGVVTKDALGVESVNKDAAEDAILVTPLSDYEKYRLYVQFGMKDRWPADQIPSPPSGN